MTTPEQQATDAALVHLAEMLSQTIHISTHCAMALEDAKLLSDERAQGIARNLKALAEKLDIADEPEPHRHATALHAVARMLEAGHPS